MEHKGRLSHLVVSVLINLKFIASLFSQNSILHHSTVATPSFSVCVSACSILEHPFIFSLSVVFVPLLFVTSTRWMIFLLSKQISTVFRAEGRKDCFIYANMNIWIGVIMAHALMCLGFFVTSFFLWF